MMLHSVFRDSVFYFGRSKIYVVLVLTFSVVSTSNADEVDSLVNRVQQKQTLEERTAAIRSLMQVPEESAPDAVKALQQLWKEKDPAIRAVVAETTSQMLFVHKLPYSEILTAGLEDQSLVVRQAAVAGVSLIAKRGVPGNAKSLLIQMASDRNPGIRADAITALKDSTNDRDPLVLAILHQAVRDRNPVVRMNAVAGIWKIEDDLKFAVTEWLVQLELQGRPEDPEKHEGLQTFTAYASAAMIKEMGTKHPDKVVSYLIEFLDHDSTHMRAGSARILGAVAQGSEEGMKAFIKQNAKQRLEKLILDDPEESVRANAVTGLDNAERAGEKGER